jgi:hypothetical protein
MKIKLLTKFEFDSIPITRRIVVHEYPRHYAAIDLGNRIGDYGLCWNSHAKEPIAEVVDDKVWMGIDRRLAVVRLSDGLIDLLFPLHTPLLKILSVSGLVAILTEQEIALFDSNGLLKCFLGLPDLAEDITFKENKFIIHLFDRSILTLDPDRYTFDEYIGQNTERKVFLLNKYK